LKTRAAPSTRVGERAPQEKLAVVGSRAGQLQAGVAVTGAAFGELVHDVVEQQVVHGSSVNYGRGSASFTGAPLATASRPSIVSGVSVIVTVVIAFSSIS
jgi:hypothetical protein